MCEDMLLIESLFYDIDDMWLLHDLSIQYEEERDGAADSELTGPSFDLATISDERFRAEFRFHEADMPRSAFPTPSPCRMANACPGWKHHVCPAAKTCSSRSPR
jgi:hypothetical protein